MPSFFEIEFPRNISYGSTFGPQFSTDVVTMPNKAEQRNINWEYPYCSGNLATGIRKVKDFEQFYNFWMLMHGKAYGWRYYDWLDHAGTYQLLGISDGSTANFQLKKNYMSDILDIWTTRKIVKPIQDTVKIYYYDCSGTLSEIALQRQIINEFTANAPAAITSGWTADTTTGIVNFSAVPTKGTGVVASFDFDVPVRFDTDTMAGSYEQYMAMQWNDIPIVELRFS